MNYIYDVLLNFKPVLYDFYEWNDEDDITHIRKIPYFKIAKEQLEELKSSVVTMDFSFLNRIKNKTEMFQKKTVKQIESACLFTDGKEGLAVFFQNGKSTLKSRLLLDEEDDLLEMSESLEETTLIYQTGKRSIISPFQTRKEMEVEKFIQRELSKMNKKEELSYLYFECFDEKPIDEETILEKIRERLKKDFDRTSDKLYRFFKLLSAKK